MSFVIQRAGLDERERDTKKHKAPPRLMEMSLVLKVFAHKGSEGLEHSD